MSEEHTEDTTEDKNTLSTYLLTSFIIVLFYIFSIFPVALLLKWSGASGGTLEKVLETIYTPLIWAMDKLDFFEKFMEAIAKLIGLH